MKYRVAVVTPYHKEESDILKQCHDSVLNQSYQCDHIVVADGFKNDMFENEERTLHVVLPRSNGDNGNTPRGIGSIIAVNAGYDAIAYLDADNWFHPDHILKMVSAHHETKIPVICCKRTFYSLEGEPMLISEPAEDSLNHVDTSCYLIFRDAFSVIRTWFMPKELGPICDRVFFKKINHDKIPIYALDVRTVSFRSQYEAHYRWANMPVPSGAKTNSEFYEAFHYLKNMDKIQSIVDSIGFYPVFN